MKSAAGLFGLLASLVMGPAYGQTVTYTDAAGTVHSFDGPPQRIVAFYDYPYGQLASLGIVPIGVAPSRSIATDDRYFADRANMVKVYNNDLDAPDLEVVAALEPDLIIGPQMDEAAGLSTLAPYAVNPDPAGLDVAAADLRALGTLFGVPERAEAAISAMEERLAAYAAAIDDNPSVMLIGDGGEPGGGFNVFGASTLPCQILERIADCSWSDSIGEVTTEVLLTLDPDIIMIANWTNASRDDHLAALNRDPLWPELAAVKSGRIVSIADYADPWPAGVLGVSIFLDTVMPEMFPETFPNGPLTDADVAAATKE